MRKQINRMIAVLFFVMALLLLVFSDWRSGLGWQLQAWYFISGGQSRRDTGSAAIMRMLLMADSRC